MISKKPSRIVESVVNSTHEDHLTVAKAIRDDAPITDLNSVVKSINFETDSDGAYTLRKPLIRKENFNSNTTVLLSNKKDKLIFDDTKDELSITNTSALEFKFYNSNNDLMIKRIGTFPLNISWLKIITHFNTLDSTLLSVEIDHTQFEAYFRGNVTNPELTLNKETDLILKRFVKVYPHESDENIYVFEIVHPEINTITTGLDVGNANTLDINLLLDNPYAIRDLYNYGTNSCTKILPYVSTNNASFSSINNRYVYELTEQEVINGRGFSIVSSINKNTFDKKCLILKAFITTTTTSANYYCCWEYSKDDGVTWETSPEFISKFKDAIEYKKVTDLSSAEFDLKINSETLDKIAQYVVEKAMVPFNGQEYSNKDFISKRPDVLVLENPNLQYKYRFLIYLAPNKKAPDPIKNTVTVSKSNFEETSGDIDANIKYTTTPPHNGEPAPEIENNCIILHEANHTALGTGAGRDDAACWGLGNSLKIYSEDSNVKINNVKVYLSNKETIPNPSPSLEKCPIFLKSGVESQVYMNIQRAWITLYKYAGGINGILKDTSMDIAMTVNSITGVATYTYDATYWTHIKLKFEVLSHFEGRPSDTSQSTLGTMAFVESPTDITKTTVGVHKACEYYEDKVLSANSFWENTTEESEVLHKYIGACLGCLDNRFSEDVLPHGSLTERPRPETYNLDDISLKSSTIDGTTLYYLKYDAKNLWIPASGFKTFNTTAPRNKAYITNLTQCLVNIGFGIDGDNIVKTYDYSDLKTFTGTSDVQNCRAKISGITVEYTTSTTVDFAEAYLTSTTGTFIVNFSSVTKTVEDLSKDRERLFSGKYLYNDKQEQLLIYKNNYIYSSGTNSSIFKLMNSINISEDINKIIQWRNYLLLFTNTTIYLATYDSEIDGYTLKILSNTVGVRLEDAGTITPILNSIYFKSGSKIYKLVPNLYAASDDVINIHQISTGINSILEDIVLNTNETHNFSYADADCYMLFIPNTELNQTYCISYDFNSKLWNLFKYPTSFIGIVKISNTEVYLQDTDKTYYFTESLSTLITQGYKEYSKTETPSNNLTEYQHAIPYADYLDYSPTSIISYLDHYPGNIDFNKLKTDIYFELDFGQKSSNYTMDKQFLETKITLATKSSKDSFPFNLDISTDGISRELHWDSNTDGALWKNPSNSYGILNKPFNPKDSSYDGILRQLIVKYSGKGKTIRHLITGYSSSLFKILSLDLRARILPKKH